MSQTPLDTNAPNRNTDGSNASNSAPEGAQIAPGATGATGEQQAAGARPRRHRRPASRRRETPAASAPSETEGAVESAAPTLPTPAAPVEQPAEDHAAAAQTAPTQAAARAAGGGRRGPRRPAKARAPQLIRRGGSEPDAAPEGEVPAPEPIDARTTIEADTLTAEVARQVERAAHAAVDASGVDRVGAAAPGEPAASDLSDTVRPADVANGAAASQESPAPQPRRYRFERRPSTAPAVPTRRPERITGAFMAPPDMDDLGEPQPAEPTAQPTEPAPENLIALASATAPTTPTGILQPHVEARASSPADEADQADEAEGPLGAAARGEDVAASFDADSAEEGDGAGQGAEDGSGAPRRRRRRRRNGSAVRHLEAIGVTEPADDEPTPLPRDPRPREPEPDDDLLFGGYPAQPEPRTPAAGPANASAYAESDQSYQMYAPFQQRDESWNVASAYEQMRQPRSPFGAPEPNTPRGFGAQPRGVATPYQERTPRTTRSDRQMDVPPISANQLGSLITQAIQQQTDRLLTEMRHTQAPPSMSVMFPPLPSTERVAVFVDVANLLYSSRNLRVAIDFGRLLEFLRGSRRLVRAHAYAPTSPEPHAEQQFLSVVKGVGYRITTKNYKTFSSGAKKADLDLDMCMDIVRLVDANAVDTVVLVSGDSDFLPLLEYCSDHGVRVEVAAFEDAASMILRQSCDLFVNLSLVDDIRA